MERSPMPNSQADQASNERDPDGKQEKESPMRTPPAAQDGGSVPPVVDGGNITSAFKDLLSWQTLAVLAAILLWTYKFQWVEEQLPFLLTAQLKVHQVLSNLDRRQRRVNLVTLVQIDDDTFWSPPFSGVQPTN